MSLFGPRYKSVSTSNVGYFDFHQGSDISVDVIFDGVMFSEMNPPNLYCMCDGIVDEIIDGLDQDLEHTGIGRSVQIKCDVTFNGDEDWGNIYIALWDNLE